MRVWHEVGSVVGNALRYGWPRGHRRGDRGDRGQGILEYVIILSMLVILLIAVIVLFGPQISSIYQGIENNL